MDNSGRIQCYSSFSYKAYQRELITFFSENVRKFGDENEIAELYREMFDEDYLEKTSKCASWVFNVNNETYCIDIEEIKSVGKGMLCDVDCWKRKLRSVKILNGLKINIGTDVSDCDVPDNKKRSFLDSENTGFVDDVDHDQHIYFLS